MLEQGKERPVDQTWLPCATRHLQEKAILLPDAQHPSNARTALHRFKPCEQVLIAHRVRAMMEVPHKRITLGQDRLADGLRLI